MQLLNGKRLSSSDKGKKMNDVIETHSLFMQAFPIWRYGSVKAAQTAAVRFINPRIEKPFTYRRARSIWEKTARRIDGEEKDAFRLAALEEDRREQRELRTRLAALDARLATVDEAFFGPSLAALREQEGGLGRVHPDGKDK